MSYDTRVAVPVRRCVCVVVNSLSLLSDSIFEAKAKRAPSRAFLPPLRLHPLPSRPPRHPRWCLSLSGTGRGTGANSESIGNAKAVGVASATGHPVRYAMTAPYVYLKQKRKGPAVRSFRYDRLLPLSVPPSCMACADCLRTCGCMDGSWGWMDGWMADASSDYVKIMCVGVSGLVS